MWVEIISGKNSPDPPTCCRALENQLYSSSRKQLVPRFSTEDLEPETVEYQSESPVSQTVLTPAAKKQQGPPTAGLETVVIDQSGKLPSIIQCVKAGDGGRVEVEQIPRLADLQHETVQAVEIANVPDPETGVTRWAGGEFGSDIAL